MSPFSALPTLSIVDIDSAALETPSPAAISLQAKTHATIATGESAIVNASQVGIVAPHFFVQWFGIPAYGGPAERPNGSVEFNVLSFVNTYGWFVEATAGSTLMN